MPKSYSRMIVVVLRGGLGNQLFQLAAALFTSQCELTRVTVDDRFLARDKNGRKPELRRLGIVVRRSGLVGHTFVRIILRLARSFQSCRVCRQNMFWRYDTEADGLMPLSWGASAFVRILDGYWQRDHYTGLCIALLRKQLEFASPLPIYAARLAAEAGGCSSLSLHVRRGDYVTDPMAQAVHGVCDVGYYQRAIELVESYSKVDKIFVFSDDLDWTARNLHLDARAVLVNPDRELTDTEEFRVMLACRHFVIANSTFSWWAARLSDSPEKIVIAPLRWFRDPAASDEGLIPPEWFRVV